MKHLWLISYFMMKYWKLSPQIRNKSRCPFLSCLFNIIPEVLAREIRQGKEIKGIYIGKEKVKLLLFREYTILYIKYPRNPQKSFQANNSTRWQGAISVFKNQLNFYAAAMTNWKRILKKIPFIIISKCKMLGKN